MHLSSSVLSLVALRFSVSAAIPSASELDSSYTYDDYVNDFEKGIIEEEYEKRREIFDNNLKEILQHNEAYFQKNDDSPLYYKHVNQFTDLEQHELPLGLDKAKLHGWNRDARTTNSRELSSSDEKFQYQVRRPRCQVKYIFWFMVYL